MSNNDQNTRVVLASRPDGAARAENLRVEVVEKPAAGDGQVLLRSIFLSLDPYMFGRMSASKNYAASVDIDGVMVGSSVCQVEESKHTDFSVGEWVVAPTGWQSYLVSSGEGLRKLGEDPQDPSYALGILGMPGFTGYIGLTEIGKPKEGETVVMAAATGPVGSTVGQVAKIKGCRVVGIAGGAEKCQFAKDSLGFDDCIDHRADDFAEQLVAACPDGIDVYFENVGGKVFDAVEPLLNTGARIPVCGLMSFYGSPEVADGPDRRPQFMRTVLVKQLQIQGFVALQNFGEHMDDFRSQMAKWLSEGKIHYRENRVEGLEKAPEAFIGLLHGSNFGKLVVEVNSPLQA
ncbi:MAG: NADP-dependent oxidoreductase [Pseudomonadota bacterium]